ncbi:MAG: RND family efflux transporter MFP subunit [Gammaproteobacteria bacterium]|jgi:RND family efflux transporter MFP subunit
METEESPEPQSEKSIQKSSKLQVLWILPPVIIGLAIFFIMVGGKQPPQRSDASEVTRYVRIIHIESRDFTPITQGYGNVRPARVWNAIAQVSGRVVKMHPRLRDGEIISAGQELFRIDPVDYELALAKAKAELTELNVKGKNSQASLDIENLNQALAEKEFKRQKKLSSEGTVAKSRADESERNMLSTRSLVQNLENTISLLPIQRSLLENRITQAKRDLANTTLKAPFNMRVTGLAIEKHQYAALGQTLFSGDSVDRVEVIAQVSLSELKNQFVGRPELPMDINKLTKNLAEITGFRPTIKMDVGNSKMAEWEAEFIRISDTVDPQTRTMGIVVAVDKPLQKTIAGVRPPLSKGMFVQVSIAGHAQPDRIVIPRSAIRQNKVYVLNAENRLETRSITRLFNQGELAIIGAGLEAGEKIVVSDLVPAIDGMLLQAEVDEALQFSLSVGE